MSEIPVFQAQQHQGTTISSDTPNLIMQQASGFERLQAQLQGLQSTNIRNMQPQITEETKQKAMDDIEAGNINSENVALIARETYRKTATNAFLADMEVRSKQVGDEIVLNQTNSGTYDTNDFDRKWDAYKKGTLSTLKDPMMKSAIEPELDKIGLAYQSKIALGQTKQSRKNQLKTFNTKLTMDTDGLKSSLGVNSEAAMQYQSNIQKNLQGMVDAGFMTPEEATYKMSTINKDAFKEMSVREFRKSTDRLEYLEQVRDNKFLSEEETTKLIESMHNVMKSEIDDRKLVEEKEELEAGIIQRDTKEELFKNLVNGTLTKKELDMALATQSITTSEYDDFSERMSTAGVAKSDSTSYKYYLTNIDHTTKDEIFNDSTLSDDDKLSLVDELEKAEISFTRQANLEIDRHFNIIEGSIFAKTDINNETTRDYALLKSMLFDEVLDLPEDKATPAAAVRISRDLVQRYENGEIMNTKKYDDKIFELQEKTGYVDTPEDIAGTNKMLKWMN